MTLILAHHHRDDDRRQLLRLVSKITTRQRTWHIIRIGKEEKCLAQYMAIGREKQTRKMRVDAGQEPSKILRHPDAVEYELASQSIMVVNEISEGKHENM